MGTLASSTSYAQGRYEGKMALPPPWKVVSPEGMVHFVADKKALSTLWKAHGLRNEYMRNTLGFGTPKREHGGWQPLASSLPEAWPEEGAKWLLHEPSGLMLVVPSGAHTFLENFDAYRPRLTDGVEPPHLRSLQKLLKGEIDATETGWKLIDEPPHVALISKEGLPLCDCCGAPLADLIGLARSTGAKRCPPPPPSPFASPSVKCRVRGGGLHRRVRVCSRPLGPRTFGGMCLLAPSRSTQYSFDISE